ncbi:flavin-containing monooxygenase, partial [Mycolicibacterium llatzerense]|uniref:flavin-containing monooxygenase n=1 Tax=Mycolicibacterium llatzerense TaxID=280871 RepID=UPI001F2BAA1E
MPDHEIAIIGAGLSGIGTAIALLGAGFDDVVIYERASDIGGTWRDNIYPGVGVDVPSYAYQFSYALKPDWSRFFAKGQEVKAYIDHCADNYGIRPLLRLDCEVNERVWDESAHLWRLRINGKEATARYVVSAIGAFIDPKPTTIQGIDDFTGQVLRSASWNYSVPLTGKRAAIIGTGASAVQIIPEIVTELAHLDVYQRTPIWVGPKFDPRIPWIVEQVFRRQPLIEDLSRRIVNRLLEFVLIEGVLNRSSARALCNGLRWGLENLWYPAQI